MKTPLNDPEKDLPIKKIDNILNEVIKFYK